MPALLFLSLPPPPSPLPPSPWRSPQSVPAAFVSGFDATDASFALPEGCVGATPERKQRLPTGEPSLWPALPPPAVRGHAEARSRLETPCFHGRPSRGPGRPRKLSVFLQLMGVGTHLGGAAVGPDPCCAASWNPFACMHTQYIHVCPVPHTPQAHTSVTQPSPSLTHTQSWGHCVSASRWQRPCCPPRAGHQSGLGLLPRGRGLRP